MLQLAQANVCPRQSSGPAAPRWRRSARRERAPLSAASTVLCCRLAAVRKFVRPEVPLFARDGCEQLRPDGSLFWSAKELRVLPLWAALFAPGAVLLSCAIELGGRPIGALGGWRAARAARCRYADANKLAKKGALTLSKAAFALALENRPSRRLQSEIAPQSAACQQLRVRVKPYSLGLRR